jgi:site-specific DNA-methyltransferase (adenine-specific)/modification methylase
LQGYLYKTQDPNGKERLKGENGRALHPTQKPEKLIEVVVSASSDKGDVVLDPFFGVGTTGVVAARLARKWIGIEINKNYVRIANERMLNKKGN